jgi:CheY-like chemotaxis protein
MDYMMPEMSGIEATKIIRESGITVPIIAVTANAIVGAKEMMLEAGMNDYLSKPIALIELKYMLKKWIPSEKLLILKSEKIVLHETEDEKYKEFWRRINQIEEISVSTALHRADGQWDLYRLMLKLMINEIEKSDTNLKEFLRNNDIKNFRIEIHGMKGSLANIGAMELAAKAFNLETAAGKNDAPFCVSNLPIFLEELNNLKIKLENAFSGIILSGDPHEIPPELPPILERLTDAFVEIDLVLIDEEMRKLNALELNDALEEEIEQIKDAVVMMDYENAVRYINKLLKNN